MKQLSEITTSRISSSKDDDSNSRSMSLIQVGIRDHQSMAWPHRCHETGGLSILSPYLTGPTSCICDHRSAAWLWELPPSSLPPVTTIFNPPTPQRSKTKILLTNTPCNKLYFAMQKRVQSSGILQTWSSSDPSPPSLNMEEAGKALSTKIWRTGQRGSPAGMAKVIDSLRGMPTSGASLGPTADGGSTDSQGSQL